MLNFSFSKERRKRLAAGAAIVLTAVLIPILFENCSPTATNFLDNPSTIAETAPFAYAAAVDTLAYMSCNGEVTGDYTVGELWTFKAGAFGQNAGLQVTQGFWNAASDLSQSDMISAIEQSPSAGAYAQLAIRSPTSPQGMQLYYGSCGGNSTSNFNIAPIDNGSTLQTLLTGVPASWYYNFNINGALVPFSGYIDFTTANPENTTSGTCAVDGEAVRTAVSSVGNGYLAVDFTNSTLDVPGTYEGALPQGNFSALYGEGFQFTFGNGKTLNGQGVVSGAQHVITPNGVTEVDLTTFGGTGNQWSCPYQIMIVRPGGDAANCPPSAQTIPPAVSNMLPASQWQVNMQLMCAVPKAVGLCYGTNASGAIAYNGTVCDPSTNTCPHYVTICSRIP